ncbi:sugar transferase [Pseudomonas protegens]|uniref:sugar transferase n=1 Tax=Pseudomonas protegens TaxID=380021 RepID=UPI00356B340A
MFLCNLPLPGWQPVNNYRDEPHTLEKIEKRVEFDLEYIENWSAWLELHILLRTIASVIMIHEAF